MCDMLWNWVLNPDISMWTKLPCVMCGEFLLQLLWLECMVLTSKATRGLVWIHHSFYILSLFKYLLLKLLFHFPFPSPWSPNTAISLRLNQNPNQRWFAWRRFGLAAPACHKKLRCRRAARQRHQLRNSLQQCAACQPGDGEFPSNSIFLKNTEILSNSL